MNKKTLLVALPMMIALALAGCTNNDTEAPAPSSSATTAPTYTPAQNAPESANPFGVPESEKSPTPVANPDALLVPSEVEAATKKASDDKTKAEEISSAAKAAAEKLATLNETSEGSDDAARAAEESQTLAIQATEAQKAAEKSAAEAAKVTNAENTEEKK